MVYKDLENKVALITGGGTGLGLAIARELCANKVKVVITGRTENVLKEACLVLGKNASYVVNDIADLRSIPELVEKVNRDFGSIDILVNNAGIHIKKDIVDYSDEDYQQVIQINQVAVFSITREVAKKMISQKSGSIVMISSMASQYGLPKVVAYTAAKTAIEGMTRSLTSELSPYGIRVNCIAPGFIETKMSASALNSDPDRKQKVLSRTPMGKLGSPEDVANAVAFLSSEKAGYIAGVVLPVDGGNSIGF